MLEGFASSYLSKENTPFLHSISTDGILSTLEPLFAFRGIEATLFTGLYPNQHDVWTEFCLEDHALENYRPNNLRTSQIESTFESVSLLFPNDRIRKVGRHCLQVL